MPSRRFPETSARVHRLGDDREAVCRLETFADDRLVLRRVIPPLQRFSVLELQDYRLRAWRGTFSGLCGSIKNDDFTAVLSHGRTGTGSVFAVECGVGDSVLRNKNKQPFFLLGLGQLC